MVPSVKVAWCDLHVKDLPDCSMQNKSQEKERKREGEMGGLDQHVHCGDRKKQMHSNSIQVVESKDVLNHWVVGSEGKDMGPFTDGEKLEGHTLRAGEEPQQVCFGHTYFKIFHEQGDLPSQLSLDFPNFSTKNSMAHQKPQSWENWEGLSPC